MGKISNLTSIFQMGWNHQREILILNYFPSNFFQNGWVLDFLWKINIHDILLLPLNPQYIYIYFPLLFKQAKPVTAWPEASGPRGEQCMASRSILIEFDDLLAKAKERFKMDGWKVWWNTMQAMSCFFGTDVFMYFVAAIITSTCRGF